MSYVQKHLIEGETIIYETRLHWIVLIAPVVLGLLFALTGVGMLILSGQDQCRCQSAVAAPVLGGHRSGIFPRGIHFYRPRRGDEKCNGNDGDQQAGFRESGACRAKDD